MGILAVGAPIAPAVRIVLSAFGLLQIVHLVTTKEVFVLILEIGFAVLLAAGVAIYLKRHSGPTRSVAHILYDTEHSTRDKS